MSAARKGKKERTKGKKKVDGIRECDQLIKEIHIPFESTLGHSKPISEHQISVQRE
jgi:hypothetical protein